MKPERFSEFKSGQLLPITIDERRSDFAFLPDELPPAWEPDTKLWPLITEARDRVATLNAEAKFLPKPSLLLRPLQRRDAITSNRIEGTHVNPDELLLFEVGQNQRQESNKETRNDWREVHQYDLAMQEGCKRIAEGAAIDRVLICELHRTLLEGARGRDKTPGQFRDRVVFVGSGNRYIPPPADQLDALFGNLEKYLDSTHSDPLVRAFIAHYQFEAIHPFQDGNGRMGRLVLSLCIFKWLQHSHAWLYLSEFFEKHKDEYMAKLFAVSANGEWEDWVRFCLVGTMEQAETSQQRCKQLLSLKHTYENGIGTSNKRMATILTLLFTNPITTCTRLAKELGVTYHTAKTDIGKLCESGVLAESHRSGREQLYFAPEIYRIAYGD
jgi:Fic family protein